MTRATQEIKDLIKNAGHKVIIPVAKNQKITYKVKFQDTITNKDKWASPPLPPKTITRYLQGAGLRRNKDYVVYANETLHAMEYYFAEGINATMLSMFAGVPQNTYTNKHYCKHCGGEI